MTTRIQNIIAAFILLSSFILFSGCSEQTPLEPEVSKVRVEGFVYKNNNIADVFINGTPVQNAQVDIYQIDQYGNASKLNDEFVVTDSEGKYNIEVEVIENRPFIITASKNETGWKGIICSTHLNKEVTIFAEPLTVSSTANAILFQEARKKQYNLSAYDLSLLVNNKLAAMVNSNPNIAGTVVDLLNSFLTVRTLTYAVPYFGGTSEGLSGFYSNAEEIHLLFARDLHFAASAANINLLIDSYYQSYIDLFINSGLTKDKVLELLEISYRSVVKAGNLNEETALEVLKGVAQLKAKVFHSSILSDFKLLQGSRQAENIKNAALTLNNSITAAANYDRIRSAFSDYNNIVIENLSKVVGMNSSLKNAIEQKIFTGRNKLYSDLDVSNDSAAIITAYTNYYSSLTPEIASLLKSMYTEDSDILAEMMILLYINV